MEENFSKIWRKIVSKIFEEISFKDFGGKLLQIFWRKIVSKMLEENSAISSIPYFAVPPVFKLSLGLANSANPSSLTN